MFATLSSMPLPKARSVPVWSRVRSLARPAIAIATALAAVMTVLGLRFGVWAATHHEMPVLLHLFEKVR